MITKNASHRKTMSETDETELDPRIQIALEKLNTTTERINRLETEYDEATTKFRILLSDSTKRLTALSEQLGGCVARARPHFEALEVARRLQLDCQRAALDFQRASELHTAARETQLLAEERFRANESEWQFDGAWQETLNRATARVTEAETRRAASGREHQRRAAVHGAAALRARQLEARQRRSVARARGYFQAKAECAAALDAQKGRVEGLRRAVAGEKRRYGGTLRELEQISNEIHARRGDFVEMGVREPGVGAELDEAPAGAEKGPVLDFERELDGCGMRGAASEGSQSSQSGEEDLDELKSKFKELAVRPVNGGEGQCMDPVWESELKKTVDKIDRIMLMQECAKELDDYKSTIETLDCNKLIDKDKIDCKFVQRF